MVPALLFACFTVQLLQGVGGINLALLALCSAAAVFGCLGSSALFCLSCIYIRGYDTADIGCKDRLIKDR